MAHNHRKTSRPSTPLRRVDWSLITRKKTFPGILNFETPEGQSYHKLGKKPQNSGISIARRFGSSCNYEGSDEFSSFDPIPDTYLEQEIGQLDINQKLWILELINPISRDGKIQ